MEDVKSTDGLSKSRSILGEITNLPCKRAFLAIEKPGIKKSKSNEEEVVKEIRVTSTQCTEIDPLEGNLLKNCDDNMDAKVLGFGSESVSKSLIDGNCLKVCDGNKAMEIPDDHLTTGVSQIADKPDVGNDYLVDGCGKTVMSEGDVLNVDLADLERGIAANSVAAKTDGFKNIDLMKGNDVSTAAEVFPEMINRVSELALGSLKISNGNTDTSLIDPPRKGALDFININASDELGDSFPADTSRTVSETGSDGGKDCDAGDNIADYQNDGDEHNADNFVLSQSGSIDCMFLPESQESRVFGVERSTELKKGDECGYICDGVDPIKACSCSFCTKAAYIWLDLNYQDIKARISAMKRSQKEASTLAERSIRIKAIEKHVAESFPGASNLETDLMYQWRSLFHHMGDILDEESNHLEARLQPLTDLREKYKVDLEQINGTLAEKH